MNEELRRLWKLLNDKYGIYTEEELRKEIENTKLDIGFFTTGGPNKIQEAWNGKNS